MTDVVVVHYGAGNTRSVQAALQAIGRTSVVTDDLGLIASAPHVVLPGVGAARHAMDHLNETGVSEAIRERVSGERPVLGICLGMQLALSHSDEDGGVDCLGLIEGSVERLTEGRIPRLGWSVVDPWGQAFYFAHSFVAHSSATVATADGVCAAVAKGSFLGVQFHPEKSGPAGLAWLDQCLSRA